MLGIETSCDETAAAVVEISQHPHSGVVCRMLSNTVVSQIDIHKAFGGVVPEIAARSHIEAILPVIDKALDTAFPFLHDEPVKEKMALIDAIAVTQGAGLGGSLLIGLQTARSLALTADKPIYPINHVESHVYANFITETPLKGYQLPAKPPRFPLLALIVSGGHTQLVLFEDYFKYQLLGKTQDDAVGEAFDKVAKILGLPYPGGPSVSEIAKEGEANKFNFPKSKVEGDYNFSFSGLKTAVLRAAQEACGGDHTMPSTELPRRLSEAQKADLAASFQKVAVDTLVGKTYKAFLEHSPASVVVAGGVAANHELRRQLSEKLPIKIEYTDMKLCTDNAAMVAALGAFKAFYKQSAKSPYSLDIEPNLKM